MRRRRATQHTRRSWRRGACWTRRTSKCGPPAAAALCVVWCCCSACCPVCVLLVLLLRGVRSRAWAVAGWLLRKRHSAPVSCPATHSPTTPQPLAPAPAGGWRGGAAARFTARCLYTKPITPVAGQPVDIFYNPRWVCLGGCGSGCDPCMALQAAAPAPTQPTQPRPPASSPPADETPLRGRPEVFASVGFNRWTHPGARATPPPPPRSRAARAAACTLSCLPWRPRCRGELPTPWPSRLAPPALELFSSDT